MRNKDQSLASELENKLTEFSRYIRMPGISNPDNFECLIKQMIDSTRRIKYVTLIKDKAFSNIIADPSKSCFNPLKAVVWHKNNGNLDEAFWLVFIFVHFGKHKINNWRLVKDVYGSLNSGRIWDWKTVSTDPDSFQKWLADNEETLRKTGRFGNHRKYESLSAHSANGTAAVIHSYIEWVGNNRTHSQIIEDAENVVGNDPKKLFDYLYKSMRSVARFGRTAKFDYLTMIGKMELANIEPSSAYLREATGPRRGARLLFEGRTDAAISASKLESLLEELNDYLGLYFGFQVLEDSLCNWQKSPGVYEYFNG